MLQNVNRNNKLLWVVKIMRKLHKVAQERFEKVGSVNRQIIQMTRPSKFNKVKLNNVKYPTHRILAKQILVDRLSL